jgi:hypothetical protein
MFRSICGHLGALWRLLLLGVLLASLLSSLFLLGTAPPLAMAAPLQGEKVSDPDTTNINARLSKTSADNGAIWTDKTVNKNQTVINNIGGSPIHTVDTSGGSDFSVALSALSQGYSIQTMTSPSDVVFVLDVSWSMILNRLPNGQTRAAVMVSAINSAIKQLMAANPNNRVAVVAYGGYYSNGNKARSYNILPLARYDISGNCFNITGTNENNTYLRVNSTIAGATTYSVHLYGGTPTQLGMYTGANVLMNNSDTLYTDTTTSTTMTRRPNIILLTDGDPTFGWEDYTMAMANETNFEHGNGSPSDMGIDVLNIATIAYWKKQVSEHYYPSPSTQEATLYTIGVDVSESHALAVLDPAHNAINDTLNLGGMTYNAKTLLDSFIATSTSITFPALTTAPGDPPSNYVDVSIANNSPTANYITSYDYTDGYYSATKASELNDAFDDIAQHIITTGTYSTNTNNSDPNFTGNVVVKDVIGQGFAFVQPRGFIINDAVYRGASLANDLVNSPAGAVRSKYTSVLENRLGISSTQASDLINSCISSGAVYYTNNDTYSTELKWYADSNLNYLSSYCDATGIAQTAPAGATCTVQLYSIEGTVTDPVSAKQTDLMYLYFEVVTALKDGVFAAPGSYNTQFDLDAKQQTVLWYIPASLIPQRTVKPVYDTAMPPSVTGVTVDERTPLRALYTVSPRSDLDFAELSDTYKRANANAAKTGYYFYTNDWRDPLDTAAAVFSPNISNPYYYFTGDLDGNGKTYLYTEAAGVYTKANTYTAGTDYYVQAQYLDESAPGYLVINYVPLDQSLVTVSGQSGEPYIAYGTARSPNALNAKLSNPTGSSAFTLDEGSNQRGNIQEQFLGNNGRLELLSNEPPPPDPPDPNNPNPPDTPDPPDPSDPPDRHVTPPDSQDTPKTGDNSSLQANLQVALLLVVIATACITTALVRMRREKF